MNDILARRARRATLGIALSAALVAGIAPATAIAAETSSPTGAVALQTEDAATAKERAYAAMQEALKNLDAAKDTASREKIAEIDTKIAIFQENYDTNLAQAAIYKESLPTMQANVDAAQAECDKAHNRTRALEAELNKIDYTTPAETIRQLQEAITEAIMQENSCEDKLEHCRMRLESHKSLIYFFESEVEFNKTHLDGETAKRDALLDDLKRAQIAYDDACKAYEEAKAAADKAASPEITKPTETAPPSGSTQPAEATPPVASPATGKDALPSSTKQANTSSGKQADTTADKLANTGDTAPSAIALAAVAAAGLGITATATRRIKNSKKLPAVIVFANPQAKRQKEVRFPNPGKRTSLLEITNGNAAVSCTTQPSMPRQH